MNEKHENKDVDQPLAGVIQRETIINYSGSNIRVWDVKIVYQITDEGSNSVVLTAFVKEPSNIPSQLKRAIALWFADEYNRGGFRT